MTDVPAIFASPAGKILEERWIGHMVAGLSFEGAAQAIMEEDQRFVDKLHADPELFRTVSDAIALTVWHTIRAKRHAEKARSFGVTTSLLST